MKHYFKNTLLLLSLFSFSEVFSEEEISSKMKSEVKILSEEERTDFSLGLGHLTAQVFKKDGPLATYYNLDILLEGINSFLNGETCKESNEECQNQYMGILSLVQNQTSCEEETTEEKVYARSFTFGWHLANRSKFDYKEYVNIYDCIQGLKDEIAGIESPQTPEDTVKLYQEYLLPIIIKKELASNKEELAKMVATESVVIINFTNHTYSACKRLQAVLESLKGEGYIVYFLDSFKYAPFLAENKITTIPTVWIYKSGKKVGEFKGAKSKVQILEIIKNRSK